MRKGGHIGETKGEKVAEHVARRQRDWEKPKRPEGQSFPSRRGRDADDRGGMKKIEVQKRKAERVGGASEAPEGDDGKRPKDRIREKKRLFLSGHLDHPQTSGHQ